MLWGKEGKFLIKVLGLNQGEGTGALCIGKGAWRPGVPAHGKTNRGWSLAKKKKITGGGARNWLKTAG